MRSWLSSVVLHALPLFAATAVFFEQCLPAEPGPVTIAIREETARVAELERPRDMFEWRGIPREDEILATEEPVIFFPASKVGDPSEDFEEMKGESLDFLSDKPGKGRGVYDTMGVGGGSGGGGRYGARFGHREGLVRSIG